MYWGQIPASATSADTKEGLGFRGPGVLKLGFRKVYNSPADNIRTVSES